MGRRATKSFRVQIAVDAWDRPRLLEDVASTFAEHGANIVSYGGTVEDQLAKNWYTAELGDVKDAAHAADLAAQHRSCVRRVPSDAVVVPEPVHRAEALATAMRFELILDPRDRAPPDGARGGSAPRPARGDRHGLRGGLGVGRGRTRPEASLVTVELDDDRAAAAAVSLPTIRA